MKKKQQTDTTVIWMDNYIAVVYGDPSWPSHSFWIVPGSW